MIRRLASLAVIALAAGAVPFAHGSSGSGIRELGFSDQVSEISADGASVAYDLYNGLSCDEITVWSPVTGSRLHVPPDRDCTEISGDATLAGTRVLWQDGQSANTYTDFEVLTADAAQRQRPAVLYSYEYTHDDQDDKDYGTVAGPFAGKGSLLVFATTYEHVKGPDTNAKLWRVDGRRATLIRSGLDFYSLSVDGGRIAGSAASDQVLLMNASGRTIRTYDPGLERVDGVVLQGSDLAVVGAGEIVVLGATSGRVKVRRKLPPHVVSWDYANGLAALVEITSIHVLRLSDGKDVRIARPTGPGLLGYDQVQIEPAGLYYTYSNKAGGHVVFVPWNTVQQRLR